MYRLWKTSTIALLALVTLAPMAAAQQRRVVVVERRPTVVIVRRPLFWGPGWYDPFYPWGPPYPYGYVVPSTGDVKLVTEMKDASVYVDGGYAGVARKLKKFPLPPGNHTIELRDSEGHSFFHKRVQVIAGKTIKLEAGYRG